MNLDFFKRGLVNTANFVPNFAFGNLNKNPVSMAMNIVGRLLALLLYFQFNEDLDIKSIIIALLFPTLYIVYIIAQRGVDQILDIFGFERKDFTDIFESSSEKCVERKGEDGDLSSSEVDKEQCENVEMGKSTSRQECESIVSNETGRGKACKYISDDNVRYRSCRIFERQNNCIQSDLNCKWTPYANTAATKNNVSRICEGAKVLNKGRTGVGVEECPKNCPYYNNSKGYSDAKVSSGGVTPALASIDNRPNKNDIQTDSLKLTILGYNMGGYYTPYSTNAYKGKRVLIYGKDVDEDWKLLIQGKIKGLHTNPSASEQEEGGKHINDISHLMIIEQWQVLPQNIADYTDLRVRITLDTTTSTCGKIYNITGSVVDYDSTNNITYTSDSTIKNYVDQKDGYCSSN